VFWCLTGLALAMSVWVFSCVRERGQQTKRLLSIELKVVQTIFSDRRFWRFTPMVSLLAIFSFAYQGLWAGPWLRDAAGLDGAGGVRRLFLFTLGAMAGTMLSGQLASRLQARGLLAMLIPQVSIFLMMAVQIGFLMQPASPWVVTFLWAVLQLVASASASGYAAIAQLFPVEQTGRVSTAINTLVLGGAFALQSIIDWILDLWPRVAGGSWDRRGYAWAMGLSVALETVAVACAWRGDRRLHLTE
jgi:hypothetical protein